MKLFLILKHNFWCVEHPKNYKATRSSEQIFNFY